MVDMRVVSVSVRLSGLRVDAADRQGTRNFSFSLWVVARQSFL